MIFVFGYQSNDNIIMIIVVVVDSSNVSPKNDEGVMTTMIFVAKELLFPSSEHAYVRGRQSTAFFRDSGCHDNNNDGRISTDWRWVISLFCIYYRYVARLIIISG